MENVSHNKIFNEKHINDFLIIFFEEIIFSFMKKQLFVLILT